MLYFWSSLDVGFPVSYSNDQSRAKAMTMLIMAYPKEHEAYLVHPNHVSIGSEEMRNEVGIQIEGR